MTPSNRISVDILIFKQCSAPVSTLIEHLNMKKKMSAELTVAIFQITEHCKRSTSEHRGELDFVCASG